MGNKGAVMGNTEGTYTATRDGVTYVYSASWTKGSGSLLWIGTVRKRDGSLTGRPSGEVSNARGAHAKLKQIVDREMASAIEKFAGA